MNTVLKIHARPVDQMAVIAELAKIPEAEFIFLAKDKARELGITRADLSKLVDQSRKASAANDQFMTPPEEQSLADELKAQLHHMRSENKAARTQGRAEPFSAKAIDDIKAQLEEAMKEEADKLSPELRFTHHAQNLGLRQFSSDEAARWTGTHWQAVPPTEFKGHALNWLEANAPDKYKKSLTESCTACAVWRLPQLPEQSTRTIPFSNVYLDINEEDAWVGFRYQAPEPQKGMRYAVNAALDMRHSDAMFYMPPDLPQDSMFHQFLNTSLPDEGARNLLQEYVGSTLLPDTRYATACFFIGEGRNGKGVMMRLVKALHRQTAAMLLDKLEGFQLHGLVGASLALVDEAPKAGINEQMLKSLIAGEAVLIDRKNMQPLTYMPTAKWIVSANHVPKFSDHSLGFWERWLFIPFDITIPHAERRMNLADEIIKHELHHVANWALQGLQRLLERGRFPKADELPTKVRACIGRAKTESDVVRGWTDDQGVQVVPSTEGWMPKAKLYSHFTQWCEEQGRRAVAQPEFFKRLERIFPRQIQEEQRRSAGQTRIRWVNLKLDMAEVAF